MSRTEFVLRTAGTFFAAYVFYLSGHNERQHPVNDNSLLVPEFWMVQLLALAAGAIAVGLWWSRSPRGQVETKQDNE